MFRNYTPVSGNDVKEIIEESVSKSYELYPIPMPTSLLHDCLDILLPHITYVVNDCLLFGSFPPDFKAAIVQPLLNKPSFDQNCPKSYRHLSNRFSSLRHFKKKKKKSAQAAARWSQFSQSSESSSVCQQSCPQYFISKARNVTRTITGLQFC